MTGWDGESYCTEPGCRNPALSEQLEGFAGEDEIVALVCCLHAQKPADCTCGFGGFHDDINPRCARNARGHP